VKFKWVSSKNIRHNAGLILKFVLTKNAASKNE